MDFGCLNEQLGYKINWANVSDLMDQNEISENAILFPGFLDVVRKFEDFEFMKHHDGNLYI